MLEALFRSVPDVSMRVQFRYEISDHLGDLLSNYIHEQRTDQSEVMALDAHRLRMWRQKENSGFFFENRLHVYLIWDPRIHAKLYHSTQQNRSLGGFALSQNKAIQRARKEHETYLAEFESILRGIEGSMEAANLGPRRLFTQELFEELKHAQHPIRRDRRPYVSPEEMIEYRSARSQVVEASILNETETYLNIDGYLYAVVSLKELPDATFPGMLQNFSTLGFPVVVSGQIVIPDQVKVLKSYKKRLQKMTAAQKDANGNFKSNPEAEVARWRSDLEHQNCSFSKVEMLPRNIGYVKFGEFPSPEFCGATVAAAMGFVAHTDAVIFDMRENHGGDPCVVQLVVSYLFDEPTHINDLLNRHDNETRQYWTLPYVQGPRLTGKPVFVLTPGETFSGAEEFTYDLQTQKRATIVGEVTGGGAHPMNGMSAGDHFMIGVPVGRPVNPSTKADWEGKGITPDLKVPAAEALETAQKLATEKLDKK